MANPSPYLAWWTSIETDLRKSLLVGARREPERLHDLLRTAFEAGQSSATPPSPSTAPEVDERAGFEAWAGPREFDLRRPHKTYHNTCTDYAWMGWQARAALASRPAEVDDEGLPPLPKMKYLGCFGDLYGYTAEQYRQGQRDAVAADRARRTKLHGNGANGWYFDCDGHYIDVVRDEAGQYSIYFRDFVNRREAWLDQADSAPSHTTNKENC